MSIFLVLLDHVQHTLYGSALVYIIFSHLTMVPGQYFSTVTRSAYFAPET